MRISKKIVYIVIGLITLVYFLRGNIYRTFIKYEPIKERKGYTVRDHKLIHYIENRVNGHELLTIKSILDKSRELTDAKLQFTSSRCDVDPNKSFHTLKTHCVGYAHFFEASCNYLIRKSELSGIWEAKTYAAKLYFWGVNIHPYFDSPFFKDHDFVIIENISTHEKICIDPTISDYLDIDEVSIHSDSNTT